MRVVAFLPARSYDYDSDHGNVTLKGIFTTIWGNEFPFGAPDFPIFIRVELEPIEAGIPLALDLQLIDADGTAVMTAHEPTRIDLPPAAPLLLFQLRELFVHCAPMMLSGS